MSSLRVSMIGTGYVGLVDAAALAYVGYDVTCVDTDEAKIAKLKAGVLPIFEPYLKELVEACGNRLKFTTDYSECVPQSDVVFIAVGTPSSADGSPNLEYLQAAAGAVGRNLGDRFTVVVNKSTVPIGSANWVQTVIRDAFVGQRGSSSTQQFAVASNPEFLREGAALHDTFYPDRTVIGIDDVRALHVLTDLYRPITEQSFAAPNFLPRPEGLGAIPLITTDIASAELIKYSANAFLALKISFSNEIAELAEKVGADVVQVSRGIGSDKRIGNRFLHAGIGWGGSCFGKDTAAIIATGDEYGLKMPIVRAAREVNARQRHRVIEKLLLELKILKGRTVGVLGVAFKPLTDDLRDSPALGIANLLLERGAKVKMHDPVAVAPAPQQPGLGLEQCATPAETLAGTDAAVVATEWPDYQNLPWAELGRSMRSAIIVDGRNVLARDQLERAGFKYIGMGR